jgi:hypothetical protein
MNRLTALESNHTLHARYVEQQTNGVREMLRRLGEDVGRLEGIVSTYFFIEVTAISDVQLTFGRAEHRHKCTSALSTTGKNVSSGCRWNMGN